MHSRTKARLGFEAARGVVSDPQIRSAAADAAPPMARLSLNVGKRFARRRTRRQMRHLEQRLNSLATTVGTYGPLLAQQLGAIAPSKQKRTTPRVATGVVIGAGMMYLLEPGSGAEHRRKVQHVVEGIIA